MAVIQLVGYGFTLNEILSIDVLSFDALVHLTSKMQALEKVANLRLHFVAAQGNHKSVSKLESSLLPKKVSGEEEFLKQWKKIEQ